MAFELEPLRLKPLTWVETPTSRGVVCDTSPLLAITEPDLAATIKAVIEIQNSHVEELTLQKLLLKLRVLGKLGRLSSFHHAVEFLFDHGLIENDGAQNWVNLLRKGAPPKLSVLKRISGLLAKPAPVPHDPHDWEQLPFLRQLDKATRREMLTGARVRHFPKGFRLCREGSRDRQLMILLSGQAAVLKSTPHHIKQVVAVLEKQAMFGETTYFLNEPRTADVLALSDCAVLCLPAKDTKPQLERQQFEKLQTRLWFLQALQRSPTFREIPGEAFDALLLHGHVARFAAGQTMVREGDAADACYFLIQGTARVHKKGAEINRLTSGSVIGEIALLNGSGGRTATAVADTDVMAIKYEWDEFWSVMSSHLVLGLALERLADKRLARDTGTGKLA